MITSGALSRFSRRTRAGAWGSLLLAVAGMTSLMACGWVSGLDSLGVALDAGADVEAPPDGATPPTTNVDTFALRTIYLGEAPRDGGPPSKTAWKDFGVNLDGRITDAKSTDVCTPVAGAPLADGTNGIDNAWGAVLLPIMLVAIGSAPSTSETALIGSGRWTLLFQVVGLSNVDDAQTSSGLSAQVFVGAPYVGDPAFDDTTNWPVLSTSVSDGQKIASGATTRFDASSIVDGNFVSGAGTGSLAVPLTLSATSISVTLTLTIHDPVVLFHHVAGSPSAASDGTIAGVLDPAEFIAAFRLALGQLSKSLCSSADGVAAEMSQALDLLADGTNVAGVTCNAISIGIGFEASHVANPTTVVPAPLPPPDVCADAGDGG